MAVSNIDKQLLRLIGKLNDSQKKSLLNLVMSFTSEGTMEKQTMEKYNMEIDQAIRGANRGNYTTFEDLVKQMESC